MPLLRDTDWPTRLWRGSKNKSCCGRPLLSRPPLPSRDRYPPCRAMPFFNRHPSFRWDDGYGAIDFSPTKRRGSGASSALQSGQAEEPTRGGCSRSRSDLDALTAVARQLVGDMRQVHRLVAAMRGLWLHRARQQVGRIGFDHQTFGRDVFDKFAQMQSAALIAEPTGDPDVPVLVEVVEQFLAGAGEAVHHCRTQATVEILHHRHEVVVGVALVQEQRLA